MRRLSSLLAAATVILTASAATASVLFTITATTTSGRPVSSVLIGDVVTIDIRVSSAGSPAVAGLGAAIFGYDGSMVDFLSGSAVSSILHETCLPGIGCFNGIDNQIGGASPLSEGTVSAGPYVQLFNGVSLIPRTGTGAQDPGLDGIVGGGDAQFRVTFAVTGATTFQIGTNSADPVLGNAVVYSGGVIADATNAQLTISVGPGIPEPGGALLMGLGLAGLAMGRWRST
ncbi:MAG: hypothetical protein R3F21_20530 [Myxococcota bacterium]